MRHRAKGRQLSRTSTHKRAMLNNMATSLFVHGRVITTEAKAKLKQQHNNTQTFFNISRYGIGFIARRLTQINAYSKEGWRKEA